MTRGKRPNPRSGTANGPMRLDRIAESLLDPVVSRAGFSSTQIIAAWADMVGPDLAARTRPEKLRWPPRRDESAAAGTEATGREATGREATGRASDGATLIVRAEGGDALELQHMSGHIVARINAIFGWRAVARISIRQAPVEVRTETPRSRRKTGAPTGKPPVRQDDEAYSGVDDADLREALVRLGTRIDGDRDTKV